MQYYFDGYKIGDPNIYAAAPGAENQSTNLPDVVDVLIVGSGSAGTLLAAQLSTFPGISTLLVERRGGPLQFGQAIDVTCRTVEMFETFTWRTKLLREAMFVNETTFWRPSPVDGSRIERTGHIQAGPTGFFDADTHDGLSEFPQHVTLSQARVQEFMLEYMRNSPTKLEANYGLEFVTLKVNASGEHPVVVKLRRESDGSEVTICAKYVVGCDGARSLVRKAIGAGPRDHFANHAWGVVDMFAVTDFPDIRLKAVIQSRDAGNIILVPREGGNLVRLYVDLGEIDSNNSDAVRLVSQEQMIATARRVLYPYTLDVRDVVWSEVYQVGQCIADRFDDVPAEQAGSRLPRVFIAGDAGHTHSVWAGQGMNAPMEDAFNLGWKLVSVLEGRVTPDLLRSYSIERRAAALSLMDFDKECSKIMSSPPMNSKNGGLDSDELLAFFAKSGRHSAGVATHYPPATVLTATATHQALAKGFTIGMRFHSARVVRLADAKSVHIGHAASADAGWRLYAFADASGQRLRDLAKFLAKSPNSPIRSHTPDGADVDSVIDLRTVFQQGRHDLKVEEMLPDIYPRKGPYGLVDYYKVYSSDLKKGPDIFDLRGINRETGAMVVVRPDQYISNILPLDAHDELTAFFGTVLLDRRQASR